LNRPRGLPERLVNTGPFGEILSGGRMSPAEAAAS
jgi:hypothetical protein